ncbi:hypothetical protein ACFVVL_27505 [Kitasatospora sp. NPDC058115]|uniref:hypothetical protein n=1 Tax=Kitasatospora sp. NPDC058115 TaxID=3346347 RepID=UPI0036DDC3CF
MRIRHTMAGLALGTAFAVGALAAPAQAAPAPAAAPAAVAGPAKAPSAVTGWTVIATYPSLSSCESAAVAWAGRHPGKRAFCEDRGYRGTVWELLVQS